MSFKQHVIELNGKRYDAVSGKIIPLNEAPKKSAKLPVGRKPTKAMDGFSRPMSKTQKSKTLMRQTVHKPVPQKPPVAVAANKTHQIQSFKQVSATKLMRAVNVPKSALVKRFGNDSAPVESNAKQNKSPQITHVQKTVVATPVHTDPLTKGMANSTSHEQTKLKRERRNTRLARKLHISPRLLSAGTLILAFLLVASFFAYQNIPSIKMRVASARSGVHGSIPGYQPAGFGLNGSISYKPGEITVSYKSHSDNRNYKLTQSTSAWNSESLLSNYIAVNRRNYQTVQDRGKTVYIYDGSNASWVDGGIWYRVEGNSQLNSEQLQSIANSL